MQITIENTTVGGTSYLTDVGNPPIDFTNAEEQISNNWFDEGAAKWFDLPASGPDFVETYGQIEYYQLVR